MDVAETIMAGISGGSAAAMRMEFARLARAAIARLSARGHAAKELAMVADAALRSDSDLAIELDRLGSEDRQQATAQLRDAMTYAGSDREESRNTRELRTDAEDLATRLEGGQFVVYGNRGQVIQNAGGTVHAPLNVRGDYRVGDTPSKN